MSAPTTHTTPDGTAFRISNIQAVREQSLFLGQKFTFQVENDSAEGGASFNVSVIFSPIAIAIASPEERLLTNEYAGTLVQRVLDTGNLQDVEIQVTSDGAVKIGEDVIDRIYPLVASG